MAEIFKKKLWTIKTNIQPGHQGHLYQLGLFIMYTSLCIYDIDWISQNKKLLNLINVLSLYVWVFNRHLPPCWDGACELWWQRAVRHLVVYISWVSHWFTPEVPGALPGIMHVHAISSSFLINLATVGKLLLTWLLKDACELYDYTLLYQVWNTSSRKSTEVKQIV